MCCGNHNDPAPKSTRKTRPTDPCVQCAYKHFHTARRLVEEYGYTAENRGSAVGELVLCVWHLWKTGNDALAEQVRDIRHTIQEHREAEVDWHPVVTALDWIVVSELQKESKT